MDKKIKEGNLFFQFPVAVDSIFLVSTTYGNKQTNKRIEHLYLTDVFEKELVKFQFVLGTQELFLHSSLRHMGMEKVSLTAVMLCVEQGSCDRECSETSLAPWLISRRHYDLESPIFGQRGLINPETTIVFICTYSEVLQSRVIKTVLNKTKEIQRGNICRIHLCPKLSMTEVGEKLMRKGYKVDPDHQQQECRWVVKLYLAYQSSYFFPKLPFLLEAMDSLDFEFTDSFILYLMPLRFLYLTCL